MPNDFFRVLMISDARSDVENIRQALEETAGYEVLATDQLEKALLLLSRENVNAIILILDPSDTFGLNTLFLMIEKMPGIPILVLSESEDRGLENRVILAGAQDFLVNYQKNPDNLRRAVEHAVLRKRMEEKVYFQATHDAVSGLPNRTRFFDRLQHGIDFAERSSHDRRDYSLAVLILDLDKFGEINETYGDRVGNLVIEKTAERLKLMLRRSDTIASLGGDRFALLLEGPSAGRGCTTVAKKILESFTSPIQMNGFHLDLETSIGVSRYPENGRDSITLYKNADTALLEAKKRTNCFVLASSE